MFVPIIFSVSDRNTNVDTKTGELYEKGQKVESTARQTGTQAYKGSDYKGIIRSEPASDEQSVV
jgi:hypothetical protein